MASIGITSIVLREADTIMDDVAELYDHITKRAYDIFLDRGGAYILTIDDWLAAERAMVRKPRVKLTDHADSFTVTVDVHDISFVDAEILITPKELLFKATTAEEPARIFRTIHLPREADVRSLDVSVLHGNLIVTGRFSDIPLNAYHVY